MSIKRAVAMAAIFRPKTKRYQGKVSDVGAAAFEEARQRLGVLAGKPATAVSDGDVFEYLARGHEDAADYIALKQINGGI